MHRLLIPFLACLFLSTPALLRAQVPHEIHFPAYDQHKVQAHAPHADMACGNAGTVTFGQFNGFSNDVGPSPIFLCFGDSLLIQHNNDADLSGDPVPGSAAGVAYAFYNCPPTITGPTLQDVIGEAIPPTPPDPCLLPGAVNGLYITQAVANGGATWFFNSGALQNTFNAGQPISLWFAPITVDDFANNNYESSQPGFKPGPCVAVNTAAAFEVVYLNEITATGISTNFGNDCLGRFTVRGGYPQYAGSPAVYTIDISLASDPNVKAIIHTASTQLFHLASVAFSVPQSGVYNVTISDGKSCPLSFQMNMNVCNPVDNVMLSFPDSIVPPGGTICLPVTVDNFSILSASFSLEWDETVLQYNGLQNVNSEIASVFGPANLNETQTANGLLGVQIFNNINPVTITIPNGSTLFEMCFTAIGPLGACSGVGVTNNPTGVAFEDDMGQNLAVSVDTGQICVSFLPLDFSFSVFDTTCLGQATLSVTPLGGVPPYDITVMETTPAGPGPNFGGTVFNSGGNFLVPNVGSTNNTPYSYKICVVDNNGLGASQCTTIVVNIPRLGAQINFAQQPLCNGLKNGIISAVVLEGGLTVTNPGPNYTFDWSPANVPNPGSQVQNGVGAGPYTVTITNLTTGCVDVASGSLGQPLPLGSQSVTNIPASCSGVSNGTITYDAEGGTPFPGGGYQYAWTYLSTNAPLGTGTANPIILGNAQSGDYKIVLTDANGCTFTDNSVTLGDLRALSVTQNSVQNVSCNGGNNGSIAITVVESVMTGNPYTFTWAPAGFTTLSNSPTSTYSNLPIGTYTLTAVDNLGCKVSDTIVITQPTPLVLDTLAIQNPICAQPNSGSICVVTQGGVGSPLTYKYAWSNGGTGNCQSGLPFGPYTVTVTDLNMCTKSLTFNLPQPTPPAGAVSITPLKCGGDGSLTANYPNGVVFVWTDANGVLIDSTKTITNLSGGDYILSVFDAGGCFATTTITLADVIPMSFSDTTLQMPTCFGFTNGQIAIGVQDGQPPYASYTWAPPQVPSGSVIFNLSAGTYAVTVTDNVGCKLSGTFVLNQPPEINLAFDPTIIGRVSCFGTCDGKAKALASYNAPMSAGNFTFLWKDGSTNPNRVDLCAGFNQVTVTDGICFDTGSVFISTPSQVSFSNLSTTPTKCFGDNTGGACITANGGNGGPYSYLWNTGAAVNCISSVPSGVYTVTLTDVKGCTNSIDTINIGEPAPIALSTSTQPLTCFGGENGQATVTVLGGVPAYKYHWEDALGDDRGSAQTAEKLTAGTYTVTVTDANNCTSTTIAILQDPPPIVGTYEPLVPLDCNGDETTLKILNITGGSGAPYKFDVDFGAVLDPNFPVSLGGGQHFIRFYDAKDCSTTISLDVKEPSPITVFFDPNVVEVELGATADLEPIITGAPTIASFTWTHPEALLSADSLSATAYTFSSLTYTLTVVDSAGCSGTGSITVNIDPNRNVFIPNAFIPANASGLNDHFNIYTGLGVEIVNYLNVYDRWGNLVYQREKFLPNVDNLSEGWDGRYGGDFVNPGVFVYISEVKFLDGRVLLYRGDVTVLR